MFQVRSLSAAAATADRRSAPRVAYRLDVIARGDLVGCLLDLSASGARVRFKQAPEVSSIQELHIAFPRWLELGDGLDACGRFVWVRMTASGATEAGFAFDELSRKESSLLDVLIQRLSEAMTEDLAE